MQDSEVVAAIVAGDPAGLAYAYDKYASPLYTYCRTLLREPADAADAVQDTFVIAASRVSALRDPSRLRPWLYAVARNECHRRLRNGSAHAPLDEATDVTDESANVPLDAERAELRALIGAALGGVGPAEREVLELQLRQGLDGGEVAAVLGISRNHAHALLSRARDQLHTALGVLLVARTGRQDCPELADLLRDWDGQLSVLMRKRINRHAERCPVCADRRRRELAPATLLGVAPLLALPALRFGMPQWLREHVLHAAVSWLGDPRAAPQMAMLRNGFPRPLDPPKVAWWHHARLARHAPVHSRAVHVGAAAVSAAGIALAVMMVTTSTPQHVLGGGPFNGHGPDPGFNAAGSTAGSSAASGGVTLGGHSSASGTPSGSSSGPTPTSSASASATGTPSGSPTASPTRSSSSPPPPPHPGKLSASPSVVLLTPLIGGTLTLKASGGPVKWSISVPSGLLGKLLPSPASGTLASGASTTVNINVSGLATLLSQLTIKPANIKVTVVLGLGLPSM
jgi:RNA polymerase sigma factor (sigma-70 family)